MATIITNTGESLIARHQAEGSPLILDRFILAYMPGQDPVAAIDRAETRPPDDRIVYTYAVPDDFRGYVSPNQVVYSMLLGSDVGDFTFNWVGLAADDGSIVTITHLPDTRKWATSGQTLGNNLTRNVLLEFTGALTTTGVTIEAKTWQVDFTARLHGIDERADLAGVLCRDASFQKNMIELYRQTLAIAKSVDASINRKDDRPTILSVRL